MTDNKIGGRYNGQMGGNGTLIGYARVSTAEQDTALQTDALRNAGCEQVFEDTASGAKGRPARLGRCAGLSARWRCVGRLAAGSAWPLLPHLIETVGKLEARGVGFPPR